MATVTDIKPRILSGSELTALKATSGIGMEHAATALSQLIGRPVQLRVPRAFVVNSGLLPQLLTEEEGVMEVVRLQILGEARGDLLLVFPKTSADRLLTRLMPTMALDSPLREEMSQSALREVGNIIASTFLSAIGNHLGTTLVPSVPLLNRLRARDFREELLNNLKSSDERCVIVEAEFSGSDDQIAGQFFLLPHLDTIERLLTTAASAEPAGNSV